jgi:hypothetical protein
MMLALSVTDVSSVELRRDEPRGGRVTALVALGGALGLIVLAVIGGLFIETRGWPYE